MDEALIIIHFWRLTEEFHLRLKDTRIRRCSKQARQALALPPVNVISRENEGPPDTVGSRAERDKADD